MQGPGILTGPGLMGGYGGPYGTGVAPAGIGGSGYVPGGGGGYGGYGGGYGGYGFGYGFGGGFGGPGMSLYDQEMYKQEKYALASSRYNLQNAQAVTAYSQANLYQQQALTASLNNQKQMNAINEKYDPKNTLPKYSALPTAGTPSVPLSRLISPDNTIMWPREAPGTPERALADEKVAQVAQEFKKDGQATTRSVIDARDALYAYGQPALAAVRRNHPSQGVEFKHFLNNLDLSLDVMAHKAPAPTTPAPPPPRPGLRIRSNDRSGRKRGRGREVGIVPASRPRSDFGPITWTSPRRPRPSPAPSRSVRPR